MNYYISPKDKSNAHRYILEFKKDKIKTYNNYYFNPSKLTYDIFNITYEKILLDKNNLELIIKIIEKLLSNNKISIEDINMKSMKNTLLPIILNYLSIFSMINTKSFIQFKIENKESIDYLLKIFSDFIKNNKSEEIIEKDLKEYIKEIIKQLTYYEIIYNDINFDLSKLNIYDYNTEYIKNLNMNIDNINENDNNELKLKKANSKQVKEKYKKLMNKKNELFLIKSQSSEEITKELMEENIITENENENDSNDEMMCFCCRNQIKLNIFEQPYGKTGLLINDFFYINSIKSTIRNELPIIIENKDINSDTLYENIFNNWKNKNEDKLTRIISCGHFFHASCFTERCKKVFLENIFTCPLCLKEQNILIPPLNNFCNKYEFLKSEKINELFDDENKDIKEFEINNESILFKKIIFDFLKNIYLLKEDEIIEYSIFLDNIFINYKGYLSFLENVFYIDGTTFHKQQQIDTMQNIILSMRYLVKNNYIKEKQIINYIKKELSDLLIGLSINGEYILGKFENMYYINLLEKIILSLSILFDYDELKETFKYIIYIFLPYISC